MTNEGLELRVKELEKRNKQLWNNMDTLFDRIADINGELNRYDLWMHAKTCKFLGAIEDKLREDDCEEEEQ